MKQYATILIVLAAAAALVGCQKKTDLVVMNHSQRANDIDLTCPSGTVPIGTVGPGGSLSYRMSIDTADLPARCNLSAGPGANQSFTVTEDSPSKWWFHITGDGGVAGPYGKNDVHTETFKTQEMNVMAPAGTVVR